KETDSEAIARLTEVACHLYLKPRTPLKGKISLLGLQFDTALMRLDPRTDEIAMTVCVKELKPGFPAAQALEVGDRLIAINGKKFPEEMASTDFPPMVRKY